GGARPPNSDWCCRRCGPSPPARLETSPPHSLTAVGSPQSSSNPSCDCPSLRTVRDTDYTLVRLLAEYHLEGFFLESAIACIRDITYSDLWERNGPAVRQTPRPWQKPAF